MQREERSYCAQCARMTFMQWRGWPHRQPVPLLPEVSSGVCSACGGAEVIQSSDVTWSAVHSPYSTGLPDHWVLQVGTGSATWGKAYHAELPCPRCGGRSIVSEMKFPNGVLELRCNCQACGVLPVGPRQRAEGTA